MSLAGFSLHAAAAVANSGAPAFTWQNGSFSATITDNGVGDITLTLGALYALAAAEMAAIVTPRATLAASGMITPGVASIANGPNTDATRDKQVTTLKEGAAGAASALTDTPFDIVLFRKDIV